VIQFRLFHVPEFPTAMVAPRFGRGDPEITPWLLNLAADIAEYGFRQPLIIYGHHWFPGTPQPRWMVKIGYNRLWCAAHLGLLTLPAIVSSTGEVPPGSATEIDPSSLQDYFVEGAVWIDPTGFGVSGVRLPQDEFA
jgi:hypothetical protein